MMEISIGICAYNEEKNIGRLIQSIINQDVKNISIKEIITVTSGCSDNTDKIIETYKLKDKRINLIIQKRREGKASAINLILKHATGDIIVIPSADIILLDNTINRLVSPFFEKNVGMAGGRPIPVDSKSTFIGFTVHLIWELHHTISLKNPKIGEIIAFRNIIKEIPNTAVDDATIESIIKDKCLDVVYEPEAIIYNKGPSTIKDFLCQRRRIYAGYLHLKKSSGYSPSTMSIKNLITLIFDYFKRCENSKHIAWIVGAIFLESYGRFLGMYDFYISKRNPYIWDMAETTKLVEI